MRALFAASLALLSLGGCREGELGGVEVGFRVDAKSLDFGRALEGTQVARSVALTSTGRAPLSVEVATLGPFSAAPQLELPGGGQASVEVVFTAGDGKAQGKLLLSANSRTVEVALFGEGVRQLSCAPTAPCRTSRFDLEASACLESISADGAACVPEECLEGGVCRAGACVGTPRTCDDGNLCTFDACAPGAGCLHTAASCPAPSRPCHVATCDPLSGCGEAPAPDSTPCGPIDCVTANLCISGQCRAQPTPEGFVCAPKTPCQAEGQCRSKVCVRPDAGEMVPSFTVPLPSPPSGGPIAHGGNLFFELCGAAADAGCQLRSYTGGGFERFTTAHRDGALRAVLAASDAGVVVLSSGQLESYGPASGQPLWSVPLSSLVPASMQGAQALTSRGRVALSPAGELLAAVSFLPAADSADSGTDAGRGDAGLSAGVLLLVHVAPDGGLLVAQPLLGMGTESLIALDEAGRAFLYDSAGPLAEAGADGGSLLDSRPGVSSLLVAGGRVFAGGRHLYSTDGGARLAEVRWPEDGGERLLPEPLLLARGRGYGFYRACEPPLGPPCAEADMALLLRAFDASDGRTLWEAMVMPGGANGRLEESALGFFGSPGVLTLTEEELSGQKEAHLQLFAEGKRLFVCPLPKGGELGGAVFERSSVYALVERGGSWRLEAYELGPVPLEGSGWPQRHGLSGTRRAR
ncbi:MAG: hypothetical protein HYZ28_09695 [Myxococcales bacterium]|nr:hypothetical protein [Myxococcales bacterium]